VSHVGRTEAKSSANWPPTNRRKALTRRKKDASWRCLSPGGVSHCTAGDGIRTHDVQLGNRKGLNTTTDTESTCARVGEGPNNTPDSSSGMTTNDDRLRRVVAAWPGLPSAIQSAILALIGAAESEASQ